MLFNSFAFLLVFLPTAFVIYWISDRALPTARLYVLALLSIGFYGYWDWRLAPLLVMSILINWSVAQAFIASRQSLLVSATIVLNLAVLAGFKYFNFFAATAEIFSTVKLTRVELAPVLGISFFTFHHIMYLTDLRRGGAPPYDLVRYALYISFFPQVLAGPLVRWREIMHQFEVRPFHNNPAVAERTARGLILLCLGLIKKTMIADPLAQLANPIFAKAATGATIAFQEAWGATLAFAFQIYFDFSGYTDMALGIALMFGIVLPQNFNTPYRSVSLQDFWRRWHMTLSRFLRDYLYVPLGGSRAGFPTQLWALMATMILGGLWHGAAWTFVAWGAAHGAALAVGAIWRRAGFSMPPPLAWLLTLTFVFLTWILFRSENFDAAMSLYSGMIKPTLPYFGWNNLIAIAAILSAIGPTSWTIAHWVRPSITAGIAISTLLTYILFHIADAGNSKFIYFQF